MYPSQATVGAALITLTIFCSTTHAVAVNMQASFSLSQVARTHKRNAPADLVRAYQRYGAAVPDALLALAEKRREQIAVAYYEPPPTPRPDEPEEEPEDHEEEPSTVPAIPSDEWDLM